jgi:oligopeptide transport system permease protein
MSDDVASLGMPQPPMQSGPMTQSVAAPPRRGESPFRASMRRFVGNKLAFGSSIVMLLLILACYVGPLFFPFGPDDADFENIAAPVDLLSWHPFGTDDLGRDLLLRVLYAGRVSLALGFFGALVAVVIGVVYGAVAGFLGGRTDSTMMRTIDVLYGIPYIFLVILINLVFGRTILSLFFAMVVTLWLTPAVIARGQAVSLKRREFIEAARACGMTSWQIIRQHIVPNTLNVVIVYASLLVLEVITGESFLSFLGLGVQPPDASWGTLIEEGAAKIDTDLRLLLLPGCFLATTLFCLNFITDGLRDAFDPNER